jgi:hypothetical protein
LLFSVRITCYDLSLALISVNLERDLQLRATSEGDDLHLIASARLVSGTQTLLCSTYLAQHQCIVTVKQQVCDLGMRR